MRHVLRAVLVLCSVTLLTEGLLAKTSTTTTVASSLNPSTHGTSVTFTATPRTATGTVTFFDFNGNVTLGSGTLNGSGVATLTLRSVAPGLHSTTATYNGDGNNGPGTSPVLAQTVNRRTMTLPSYCVH
jgi:hypothetical protein